MKAINEKAYILILETYFYDIASCYNSSDKIKDIFQKVKEKWEQGEPAQNTEISAVLNEFRIGFIKAAKETDVFFSARAAFTDAEQKVIANYKNERKNNRAAV